MWIEQYQPCGCVSEAATKKDLLGYCAQHGSEAKTCYRIPSAKPSKGQRIVLKLMRDGHHLYWTGRKGVWLTSRFLHGDYSKVRFDTFEALRRNGWIEQRDDIPEGEIFIGERRYYIVSKSGKRYL